MSDFDNLVSEFVYIRTYSRWLPESGRRESWPETVDRYIRFISDERGQALPDGLLLRIKSAIQSLEVMPSMRALWSAGEAARLDNVCMYNCAYSEINSISAFADALYILMCGTGFGFSISQSSIALLPEVPEITKTEGKKHLVEDSRRGWSDSLLAQLTALFAGKKLDFDYSRIRQAGSRLKTMGGRTSGPEPLRTLHEFVNSVFVAAKGRKLRSIECLDLLNSIAEIVIVGGVRRSSQICLSDLSDDEIRKAKIAPFPARRAMSNNSAIYLSKPNASNFDAEWHSLQESGTGERGIFNLGAAQKACPERRDPNLLSGTNPCGEIILRSQQFCNLSEIVARPHDTLDSLSEKVRLATWIGTIQSTFTHFPNLSSQWRKNCEEERLLGVSITGICDAMALFTAENLQSLKLVAIETAKIASQTLGIAMPAAITCVKPSGTVSQLVNSSSGIHPRYAKFYLRRFRISAFDPVCKMLKDLGVPMEPEVGQEHLGSKATIWVVTYPVASPKGAMTREDLRAIDQLEIYKRFILNWCEHNASMTVYVRDDEWDSIKEWVLKNWDICVGISFLPYDVSAYKLLPYEDISESDYQRFLLKNQAVDFGMLAKYEMKITRARLLHLLAVAIAVSD